jgi:hypothetical protein
LLLLAACAYGSIAKADPAPRGVRMVSGAGTNTGGRFAASASGAVFELPSRAKVHVFPNAVVRLFPVPQELLLTSGRATTWSLTVTSGRVDVEMPSSKHTAVLATMGKLNAAVTKGHAVMIVTRDEATVANLEGEVKTLLSNQWQAVPVGSIATLSTDSPSFTTRSGLPFPKLSDGPRMFIAPSNALALGGFRWAPVPGAARYELRIRRLVDGKVMDQRGVSQPEFADGFAPVAAGDYGLSLRSVDARGLESSWSPEAKLRVIGVVLPPGSYSNDRAIFIGAGQQVRFTNASGLELAYSGAGSAYSAALGTIPFGNSPIVIGLRSPGSFDVATARLEPRDVYADVRIGPKRALWPRDPVSIDIQLMSKAGAEIPSFLQVVPKVTLGLEPLDLIFEREGNVLHAVIPPSDGPGPWVLRVEVADQFGVPLGHDFLEVASQPRVSPPAVRIVKEAPTARPSAKTKAATPSRDAKMASSD